MSEVHRSAHQVPHVDANLLEFSLSSLVALLYVAPSIVALTCNRGHVVETLIVNAMLAWTGIGWLFAMYLALHDDKKQNVHIDPRYREATTSPGSFAPR